MHELWTVQVYGLHIQSTPYSTRLSFFFITNHENEFIEYFRESKRKKKKTTNKAFSRFNFVVVVIPMKRNMKQQTCACDTYEICSNIQFYSMRTKTLNIPIMSRSV